MASGSSRNLANNNVLFYRRRRSGGGSDAFELLRNEPNGLALDFTDDYWQGSTGFYGSAVVKESRVLGDLSTTASDFLTYTSPSLKMVMGPAGTLRYAAHNLALYSEQFDNAAYTKVAASISANATTASDGTTTADKLVENSATAQHYMVSSSGGALAATVSGASYSYTFNAKAAERSWIWIEIYGNWTAGTAYVNLSDGTLGTTSGSGAGVTTELVGNGWYKITVPNLVASGTASSVAIYTSTGNGTNSYAGDGTSGVFLWGLHLRRTPSDSTYLSTTTAARYALPLEWSAAGAQQGLLVEEARTNLALRSQDLGNALYTDRNVVTTDVAITSFDGTAQAQLMTSASGAGTHSVGNEAGFAVTTAVDYAMSLYFKKGTHGYVYLSQSRGENNWIIAVFDLDGVTGAATQTIVGASSGTITSTKQEALTNGWIRLSLVGLAAGTAMYPSWGFAGAATGNSNDTFGNVTFSAAGTETAYIGGLQEELGSFPTSYIQTFASTVTRAVDNISLLTSAFPFSGDEVTFYGSGSWAIPSATARAIMAYNNSGTFSAGPGVMLRVSSALTTTPAEVACNGTSVAKVLGSALTANQVIKIAGITDDVTNAQRITINGLSPSGNTTSDWTGTNSTWLQIGAISSSGTQIFNGHIRQLMVLPRIMSDAELQTLTTDGLTSGNLLSTETAGLALDFTDGSFGRYELDYNVTAYNTSLDTTASSLLTYTSPSVKMCMGPSGTLRYQAHNLRRQSNNLATTWTSSVGGTGVASVATNDYALGPNGLTNASRLQLSLGGGTTSADISARQQNVALAVGATFVHSVWLRSTDGTSSYVMQVQGADGSATNVTVTGTWQQFTATGVSGGTVPMALRLRGAQAPTNSDTADVLVWGDHVYQTPADTTFLETTTAARYALPLEWSSAGVLQGLLVEEARTNLALRSQDLGNALYTDRNVVTTDVAITSFDGTAQAQLMTSASGAGTHSVGNEAGFAVTTAVDYAMSLYFKKGTHGYVYLSQSRGENNWIIAVFDLDGVTGAATQTIVGASSGTITSTKQEALTNGWIRLSLVGSAAGTAMYPSWGFASAATGNSNDTFGNVTFSAAGTETAYIGGLQEELGSFATSYIQTFASTVTRAADNISLATSAFPYSTTGGTLYVYFDEVSNVANAYFANLIFDAANRLYLFRTNSSALAGESQGGTTAGTSVVSTAPDGLTKLALAYAANDVALVKDGGTPSTDATFAYGTAATSLSIGQYGSGSAAMSNVLKAIVYLPRRMSNAELQTLTT